MCNAWLELVCEYAQQTRKSCTWWHILGHEVSFSLHIHILQWRQIWDARRCVATESAGSWRVVQSSLLHVVLYAKSKNMKLDYTLHAEGGSIRSREVGGHRFILFIHTRFNLSLRQLLFLFYLTKNEPGWLIPVFEHHMQYMQSSLRSPNSFHARIHIVRLEGRELAKE